MISGSVQFLWLCGPNGVGKSVVGYEIFQQVYRSGIKASFMDFDHFGLCYPSPPDDPRNHQVKSTSAPEQAAGPSCPRDHSPIRGRTRRTSNSSLWRRRSR